MSLSLSSSDMEPPCVSVSPSLLARLGSRFAMPAGNYTAWNKAAGLRAASADREMLAHSQDNVLDLEPTALTKLALVAAVVRSEKLITGKKNAANDYTH